MGSSPEKRRRRALNRVWPAAYLAAAAVLAAVVLPSVLRPPPEQSQSSAALSPDAPPSEDPDVIIQSLRQAASRTAGASGQEGGGPTTTTTTIVKPSRGQCFGDPPRQTDSGYAPPCRAAFTGDNGGSTHPNVSGEEVRIAFWHALGMPAERGPIADSPPPGESAGHRTARVLQQYFNERYELYGRRLRLVAVESNDDAEEAQRASAVHEATANKAFAAIHLSAPFCEEFVRRDLICFNGNGFQKERYETYSPHWWSYQMDTDTVDRIAAEYACKKLVGRNADFAGVGLQGLPRRIGIVTESTVNNNHRSARTIEHHMKELCGVTPELVQDMDPANGQELAQTLAALRQRNITTVVLEAGIIAVAQLFTASDNSGYNPEWVMINSYGMDFNDAMRLIPSQQVPHVFGMSGWELPVRFADTDCYRAYKSIDPSTAPDQNFCRLLWISIEHTVNGFQEAGPELTPETFRRGLYSLPLQEQRYPWSIGGGYGAGDHSFVDDFVEIWWDPNAIDPDGNEPGAFRHTADGRRWRAGTLDGEVRVFREGVTGYDPQTGATST